MQWGRKHEFARANNLLMPLFDAAIRRRLGQPGEPLQEFPESAGWLGDVSEWKTGIAAIAPFDEYQGDKAKACWLPDEKTARAWQAFVTHKPTLELKNPSGLGDGQPFILHHVGERITVERKSKSQNESAAPVEVFAGGKKLGQLQAGKLEIQFDQPGVYPLYLRSTDADGAAILSRPNTVLVAK